MNIWSRTLYRYVDWNEKGCRRLWRGWVVPYIGTWIETNPNPNFEKGRPVVPYIGTWIETIYASSDDIAKYGRTLYRYVDWNEKVPLPLMAVSVVPYIGTWIETKHQDKPWYKSSCRTLYRYVDWNFRFITMANKVARRTLYRYVDWNSLVRMGKLSQTPSYLI